MRNKIGDTLFECANCKGEVTEYIREKVPATDEEIGEINEYFIPHIDAYRLEWRFYCKHCDTNTIVRTEVDRY